MNLRLISVFGVPKGEEIKSIENKLDYLKVLTDQLFIK